MQHESNQLEKTMQNRHLSVSQFSEHRLSSNATRVLSTAVESELPQFEGYLFKRTSKGFKSWNRRWFYLRDNQLLYVYVFINSTYFLIISHFSIHIYFLKHSRYVSNFCSH